MQHPRQPSRLTIASVVALALAAGALAATAHLPSPATASAGAPASARGTSIGWAPAWLAEPLRRAIADATDPRERDKATGLPKDAAAPSN